MNFFDAYKDPKLSRELLEKLTLASQGGLTFMEVCGTHTVSIFQSGIHSLLPGQIVHISGPGCPVCVTHDSEVAAFLEIAALDGVIVATFGDLMRVPGPGGGNLKQAKAEGARVEVVYSPVDALVLAEKNPEAKVVFLGVGFETTAPTVAATLRLARQKGLTNFFLLCLHKLVPPALRVLLSDKEAVLDGLLLPGHVSAIIGMEPYAFIASEFGVPAVVAGFEPVDILRGLLALAELKNNGLAKVLNAYPRAVAEKGNPTALAVMREVFTPCDAAWRGIGTIPGSGLALAQAFADFDALGALGLTLKPVKPLPGCRCGDVLKGKMRPDACPLFGKACTPANPVGPCMVSTEGSCAAYYKFLPL